MPRSFNSVMGFPPFRGAVRQIILASAAIYVVILLLLSFAPGTGHSEKEILTASGLRQAVLRPISDQQCAAAWKHRRGNAGERFDAAGHGPATHRARGPQSRRDSSWLPVAICHLHFHLC